MQIDFCATPEAKRAVLHHFGHFEKTTVMPTHDGVHITVHADGPCREAYLDAYIASMWPGVKTMKISRQNLG